MASGVDSLTNGDDDIRQLYERYCSATTEEERREIALEMGRLDAKRHADIYAVLETE